MDTRKALGGVRRETFKNILPFIILLSPLTLGLSPTWNFKVIRDRIQESAIFPPRSKTAFYFQDWPSSGLALKGIIPQNQMLLNFLALYFKIAFRRISPE